MKKIKPFSRKYYSNKVVEIAKALIRDASHLGMRYEKAIEEQEQGIGIVNYEDYDFYYTITIRKKSKYEKEESENGC